MKKYIVFLCLITAAALLNANPIRLTYLNEFMLTPSGWKLELHSAVGQSLNGVMIKSKTDSAYFRPWAVVDTGYYVITPDSLSKPLFIDQQGDVIILIKSGYEIDRLHFGDPVILRYGQSLCWGKGGYFYIDNSPTIGYANDTVNAQGTLTIFVTDGTQPIGGATVTHYDDIKYAYSDMVHTTAADGRASCTALACNLWFMITKQFYITQFISVHLYPESTVTRAVQLQPASSVHDQQQQPDTYFLCDPYPNPFNPSTTIRYSLPAASMVKITITDIVGRMAEKILQRREDAGWKEIQWQAKVASGFYFCTLEAVRADGTGGSYKETKKILLVR